MFASVVMLVSKKEKKRTVIKSLKEKTRRRGEKIGSLGSVKPGNLFPSGPFTL